MKFKDIFIKLLKLFELTLKKYHGQIIVFNLKIGRNKLMLYEVNLLALKIRQSGNLSDPIVLG